MEIIIGAGVIVFIIGLFALADYFACINSRALGAAYASLSGVIAERDTLHTANVRAQDEIRALEDKLREVQP